MRPLHRKLRNTFSMFLTFISIALMSGIFGIPYVQSILQPAALFPTKPAHQHLEWPKSR